MNVDHRVHLEDMVLREPEVVMERRVLLVRSAIPGNPALLEIRETLASLALLELKD